MLTPLNCINFKSLTIGYFLWTFKGKRKLKVVRVVGETDKGYVIDLLFKPNLKISTMINEILKQTKIRRKK